MMAANRDSADRPHGGPSSPGPETSRQDAVTDQTPGRHRPDGSESAGVSSGDGRQEVAGESGTDRDIPHTTPQDRDSDLQDELPSPADVPVLPSNASGVDKVPVDQQDQAIDDESMYDGRPEEDKNQPPSSRS